MKKMIKTILFFFTAALFLTSCSSDNSNPPTAGFSLSATEGHQWDMVDITNSSTDADDVTYSVTGGASVMVDDNTIQFFDEATYTVTQNVSNGDGTDTTTATIVIDSPDNKYTLDGADLPFTGNAFWYDATAMGGTIYIRFLGEVTGQTNPNLVKIFPVTGPNPLEATYTWNDSGDIGTYDAGMTANYAGFSYDWTTNGDSGQNLKIDLVYEDINNSENNIYDITLSSYTLNYGNWDFATFTWMSEGTKSFSFQYRGKIDPVK